MAPGLIALTFLQSLMYRDVVDAHNRVKLANELMNFHMHVRLTASLLSFRKSTLFNVA